MSDPSNGFGMGEIEASKLFDKLLLKEGSLDRNTAEAELALRAAGWHADQAEAARRSADAAERGADAAETSARYAKENARYVLLTLVVLAVSSVATLVVTWFKA